jgi:hypothetical protein
MKLDHTIILPPDNPALATELFTSLIEEQDVLTLIILGDDDVSKNAVQCADVRANASPGGFERKVAWMLDRDMFDTLKGLINDGAIKVADIDKTKTIGIAISLTDQAMDVIKTTDTIDFIRMEKAFLKAGTILNL